MLWEETIARAWPAGHLFSPHLFMHGRGLSAASRSQDERDEVETEFLAKEAWGGLCVQGTRIYGLLPETKATLVRCCIVAWTPCWLLCAVTTA